MNKFFFAIGLALFLQVVDAQDFADKKNYLVDSLVLNEIDEKERFYLDSILTVYHNSSIDSIKFNALENYIEYSQYNDVWSKYALFTVEEITFIKANDPDRYAKSSAYLDKRLCESYLDCSLYQQIILNNEAAIKYGELALQLAEQIENKELIAASYSKLARAYIEFGDPKKSLEYSYEELLILEELKDTLALAWLYNNMSAVYESDRQFDKVLDNFKKSFAMLESLGNKQIAESLLRSNIGGAYLNLGDTLNARIWLKEAVAQGIEVNYLRAAGNANNYLGNSFKNNPDSALFYFTESMKAREKINDVSGLTYSYASISSAYLALDQLNKAREFGLKSVELAEKIQLPKNLVYAYNTLIQVYSRSQNWKEAYQYQQLENQLRDSLLSSKNSKKIFDLQSRYKYQKQKALDDKENEQRLTLQTQQKESKQRIIYVVLISLIVVSILLIVIFMRLKKSRRQNVVIESQAVKLRELDKVKTKFFNNVAHELRTPLTLMSGHMESMLAERFGGLNENQRKSLLVAKNNSKRLLDMVSELLDLGKLESSKMELHSKPIMLKPFLDRIFFTFESLAYQFQITLRLNYTLDAHLVVLIDQKKMEKVFNNLIHNALKFTPREGEITFTISQEKEQILFEVADNGMGIPAEEVEKVFDRYFQTEKENAPAQGGTGIGLSIAKEFAKLHNGNIDVVSEEGKGSAFTIRLPDSIISESSTEHGKEEVYDEVELPIYPILEKKDKVILVVDDHKEMQNYISEILGDYARVIVANDGIEALRLLEQNKVDLLTIDVMMPNMDGFAFLKQMKLKSEYAQLPIIMLTARASEEDKLDALTIGVNDYITKPFSQAELIARIANLIENKVIRDAEPRAKEEVETVNNQLIEKLQAIVNRNLDNVEFGVVELAKEIGLSERQLGRNVKKATGLSPLKFIREVKLLYVYDQLRAKKFETVADASYAIGIENPSHFNKIFLERFGKNPSYYIS